MTLPSPRCLALAAVCCVTATLSASPDANAADRRFALVVGHNHSDDPTLDALRYADDDALRYHGLLSHVADRVLVLARPDAETARLPLPAPDGPPTRAAVLAALDTLRAEMAAARAAGDRPVLYFVYSGHGQYDAEGRGYVHLEEGRFTTRDLFHHVLGPAQGDPVVLIVDACNAALLVGTRGGGERRPTRPTTLSLTHHPNVGLILASSTAGETHEWGRYLAGVFSHEVRSGLVGPADLDDDGRVTFAELAAFVAAANARVANPTVRIAPTIRPPLSDPELALVDLSAARFPRRVRVDAQLAGRAHVVDGELVRYADFHKAAGAAFWLALPAGPGFRLVLGDAEHVIPDDARGDLTLAGLQARPNTVLSARGAGSEYFERTLFSEPHGRAFAVGYLQREWLTGLEQVAAHRRPWHESSWGWVASGAGVAALTAGTVFALGAADSLDAANRTPWADERARLNDAARQDRVTAGVLMGLGTAALTAGLVTFWLDRPVEVERTPAPFEVEETAAGVRVHAR